MNFSGGDNTKVECELPGDHTRRGEVEGGLPHDPTLIQGETSSVGSSMSERRNLAKGKEGVNTEDGYQTPENVRRLREIWEQGTKQSCLRWRSKGGLGPLHYGINSPSMLNRCSFADSESDIIHCNNQLKQEINEVESVRIWEAGRQLGVRCSDEEVDIVVELEGMEERDKAVKKLFEEGSCHAV